MSAACTEDGIPAEEGRVRPCAEDTRIHKFPVRISERLPSPPGFDDESSCGSPGVGVVGRLGLGFPPSILLNIFDDSCISLVEKERREGYLAKER